MTSLKLSGPIWSVQLSEHVIDLSSSFWSSPTLVFYFLLHIQMDCFISLTLLFWTLISSVPYSRPKKMVTNKARNRRSQEAQFWIMVFHMVLNMFSSSSPCFVMISPVLMYSWGGSHNTMLCPISFGQRPTLVTYKARANTFMFHVCVHPLNEAH